jgi:hypothetical protein
LGPSTLPLQAPDLDGAIDLVNSNEHGNGTAIFTQSGAAARKFQHEVCALTHERLQGARGGAGQRYDQQAGGSCFHRCPHFFRLG